MLVSALQAAKAAMKAAAGTLAEALAERDAAGDERASIEAQLQATLQSVAGDAATTISYPEHHNQDTRMRQGRRSGNRMVVIALHVHLTIPRRDGKPTVGFSPDQIRI